MKKIVLGYTVTNETGGYHDWRVSRGEASFVGTLAEVKAWLLRHAASGYAAPTPPAPSKRICRSAKMTSAPTARGTQKRSKKP